MKGPEPCVSALQGSFSTATELLDQAALQYAERLAFIEGDKVLTFGDWRRASDAFAQTLLQLGVEPGDVIALFMPSSIDYAICYQAAMRIRAITSGINPRLGPAETGYILDVLDPAATVVDDGLAVPGTPRRVILRSAIRQCTERLATLPVPRRDDTVAIVWTGGTTGTPKGAVFDHCCLAAVARGTAAIALPGDRRFAPVPFAHTNYMTRSWDEIQRLVTTVIPPQPWSARPALECIVRDRVNVIQMVPTQWRLLLNLPETESADFSNVRLLYTGGSSVPTDLIRELKQRFACPVVVRYSSTEIAVGTGTVPDDSPEVVANTVGRTVEGVELSIVDERTGLPVPVGSVGRLRFRSEAVMRGYWRDTGPADALSSDGWFMTSDLGHVDEQGNLHFAGRVGDMYIRGAYNVYPIEVENTLSNHSAVVQAAVVGVGDEILGEIGVAFIVARRAVQPEELREWCRRHLADYKAPDHVCLVDSLPVTPLAKIDKRALVKLATASCVERRRISIQ